MVYLVRGRAGSGKSRYLIKKARDAMVAGHRVYMIVPDQATFNTEGQLAAAMPSGGILGSQVLSFSRLCDRVLEQTGGIKKPYLDAQGAGMALSLLLQKYEDALMAFSGHVSSPGFTNLLYEELCELRRYSITPQMLKETGNSPRVKDLALLLEAFENEVLSQYTDTVGRMERMIAQISQADFLKGSHIFIDGFEMVTDQLLRAIRELFLLAEEVTISFRLGEENDPDAPIFETERIHYGRIERIAQEVGATIRPVLLRGETAEMRQQAPALRHLEKNLFAFPHQPYDKETTAIGLWAAPSPREEAYAAARYIRRLVREEGYRYRDFFIQLCDPTMIPQLKQALGESGIPFFLDEKRPMAQKNISRFCLSLLAAVAFGKRVEDIADLLKTGLYGTFSQEEIDGFCAHCTRKNIRYLTERVIDREADEAMAALLMRIHHPLMLLEKELAGDAAHCARRFYKELEDRTEGIEEYLQQVQALDLEAYEEERLSYQGLLEILSQMHGILGDAKLSPRLFYQLMKTSLLGKELAILPPTADCVDVGDLRRSRAPHVKCLVVLGATDANLPRRIDTGGVLPLREREQLMERGLWMGNSLSQRLAEEELAIYGALSKPTQRLYVSYPLLDKGGGTQNPSGILQTLSQLFSLSICPIPDYRLSAQGYGTGPVAGALAGLGAARAYGRGEPVLGDYAALYEKSLARLQRAHGMGQGGLSPLEEETAKQLFLERDQISASRMEAYARCPYQHFIQNGLSPRPVQPPGVTRLSRGNILHRALELLVAAKPSWDLPEEEIRLLARTMLERVRTELAGEGEDPYRSEYQWQQLLREAEISFLCLFYQMEKSLFMPVSTEDFFYENLFVEVEYDGQPIRLIGRIDRVDAATLDGKRYLRVIDYKSGKVRSGQEEMLDGTSLQLPLYAAVAKKQLGGELAGMFFMPIGKASPADSRDAAREQAVKAHRLKGVLRADTTLATAMDQSLAPQGSSDTIPVALKKDGSFTQKSSTADVGALEEMIALALKKAKEIVGRMLTGEITPAPISKKDSDPCDYCDYRAMCPYYKTHKLRGGEADGTQMDG
ncbi:PD-(D/E)XK nuclease family protein [Eubacteriales bacterium OttesenSCG-928-M02]|nr:PD-(D/E)XK nuclease family protein [Eubacteriales bacterium OttesenSCG-928-M02]